MKILVSTLMKDVQLNESLRFYHYLFDLNDRLSDALLESIDDDGKVYPYYFRDLLFRLGHQGGILSHVGLNLDTDILLKFYDEVMDPLIEEMYQVINRLKQFESFTSSFERNGIKIPKTVGDVSNDLSKDIEKVLKIIKEYTNNKSPWISAKLLYNFYNVFKQYFCEDIKQEWAKNLYTFLVQIQKLIVLCMDTLEVDIEEENKDE